jgi:hypothetical protein
MSDKEWYKDKKSNIIGQSMSHLECDNCGSLNVDFDIAKKTNCDGSEELRFVKPEVLEWSDEEIELFIKSEKFNLLAVNFWNQIKLGVCCADKPINELDQERLNKVKKRIIRQATSFSLLRVEDCHLSFEEREFLNSHFERMVSDE